MHATPAANRSHFSSRVFAAVSGMLVSMFPARASDAGSDEIVHLDEITIEDIVERREHDGWSLEIRHRPLHAGTAANGSLPTLRSVLAPLPGLVVQDGFGGIDPPRLTSRGSGLQSAPVSRGLLWTIDGLPLNAADGSFNAALIEPAIAGSIHFRPGAIDPLAAGLALGGSLNLETPFTGAQPRAWLAVGEDGYVRGAFSQGAARGEDTLWLAGSIVGSDGWRRQSAQRRTTLTGCFTHSFGPSAPLLFVRVYAADASFDVPGPLTLGDAGSAPTTVSSLVSTDRPRRETDFARAAFELQWANRDLRRLSLDFAAQHTRDWFRQLRANGISRTNGDDFTLRAQVRRNIGDHTIHAGFCRLWGERSQTRFTNLAGNTGPAFAVARLVAHTSTGWIEDRWNIDDATMLTSSFSLVSLERESTSHPAASGRMRDSSGAGRVVLRRRLGGATALSLSLARGHEAPAFDDLLAVRGAAPDLSVTWTPLRSQTADTVEASIRRTWKSFTFDATGYDARWEGELLRLADASGAPRGAVNAGPTRHRGLETALRWQIRHGARPIALAATHTWSEARFRDDIVHGRNRLAGLPPRAGEVSVESLPDKGWFGVLSAGWISGRTFADHANRLAYRGHVLVQARAGWIASRWSFALEINNALDRAHIASTSGVIDIARAPASTALFLPGAPRSIATSIEWRW